MTHYVAHLTWEYKGSSETEWITHQGVFTCKETKDECIGIMTRHVSNVLAKEIHSHNRQFKNYQVRIGEVTEYFNAEHRLILTPTDSSLEPIQREDKDITIEV